MAPLPLTHHWLFTSTPQVNTLTLEWRDGLMALSVRDAVSDTTDDHKWVICDGPVDALWIENMNTVLDDNKMLCLANSERIKLTSSIHMVFEVRVQCFVTDLVQKLLWAPICSPSLILFFRSRIWPLHPQPQSAAAGWYTLTQMNSSGCPMSRHGSAVWATRLFTLLL